MSAKQTVVLERTYTASVQQIWDLWTTRAGFESWWGPVGFRVEVQRIEPVEGGALHYDMIADSPEMISAMKQAGQPVSHPTRSRFRECAPQTRLVLTSVIDFLPGVPPYESNIAVDITPVGDRVRMVVTLDAMHDATFTQMQAQGFTSQLTKLDARFA